MSSPAVSGKSLICSRSKVKTLSRHGHGCTACSSRSHTHWSGVVSCAYHSLVHDLQATSIIMAAAEQLQQADSMPVMTTFQHHSRAAPCRRHSPNHTAIFDRLAQRARPVYAAHTSIAPTHPPGSQAGSQARQAGCRAGRSAGRCREAQIHLYTVTWLLTGTGHHSE